MDLVVAHEGAQHVFATVLANVTPAQRALPTPCTEWNVEQVVAHVVAGNTYAATGERPPAADDPIGAYPTSAGAAMAAFRSPGGLERVYSLPFGEITGAQYVGMRATDVLTHAWDMARATGQPTAFDEELSQALLEVARRRPLYKTRPPGIPIGPEQPCPPGRPAADRLAAFLGRPVEGA